MQPFVDALLEKIEWVDKNPPDDEWDGHHHRGFRSGLICAIGLWSGKKLNNNMTYEEIKQLVR